MYSDLYIKQRNNKPLLVIAGFVMILFTVFVLVSQVRNLPSQAQSKSLKLHEAGNITATQATITWVTEEEETGWVLFGSTPDTTSQSVFDERDLNGQTVKRRIHSVTLTGLQPEQLYYYKIVSNNAVVRAGNTDTFQFQTAYEGVQSTNLSPAYGTVIDSSGKPYEGALVIYRIEGAYPFITLTKSSGEWLIPLQQVIERETGKYRMVSESETASIEITDGKSTISAISARIQLTNPLPQTIILGKNYQFLTDDNILPAHTDSRVLRGDEYEIAVILPKEGAIIPAPRPVLKGTAQPGAQVELVIDAEPAYISRITADNTGSWFVDVPVRFPPGTYTLTVKTPDASGNQVTIHRTFTLVKSGEQVLGDATPEATLTPTTEPTTEPTASPSATIEPSPTELPIETPSPIASATPSILPTSGAFHVQPYFWGSIGLMLLGATVLLVL